MTNKKIQLVLLTATAVSLASLGFAALTGAQTSGRAGSSVTVTRTPFLSIVSVPDSISFPEVNSRANARDVFSNANDDLPVNNLISLTDSRDSGGFTLQAQASDFVSGENTIPASALSIITSTSVDPPPGEIDNNVFYLSPFTGPKTVTAPLNTADDLFGEAKSYSKNLGAPVDILSGCLPSTEGRIGTMAVGVAFSLKIPPYTVPGTYNATITYTLTDFTSETCP